MKPCLKNNTKQNRNILEHTKKDRKCNPQWGSGWKDGDLDSFGIRSKDFKIISLGLFKTIDRLLKWELQQRNEKSYYKVLKEIEHIKSIIQWGRILKALYTARRKKGSMNWKTSQYNSHWRATCFVCICAQMFLWATVCMFVHGGRGWMHPRACRSQKSTLVSSLVTSCLETGFLPGAGADPSLQGVPVTASLAQRTQA